MDIDRIFILTDSNVEPLTADMFAGAPRLVVPAGEGAKSLAGAESVWRFLVGEGALRRSALVNIGGGMVCDLGGFAASTFMRGIPHINLPTTLLAAVDAAVGGKTGINFAGLKNEIGTFAMPLGVFPLTSLFGSLPEDEWLSGVGEALKTGFLAGEQLFSLASSADFIVRRDPAVVREVVERCAAFKSRIVEEDFREKGRRRILNLGHTWGHALESHLMAQGRPVPHGIAVAYGILEVLRFGVGTVGTPAGLVERYETLLRLYFPEIQLDRDDRESIEALMLRDKKNRTAGVVSRVLLKDIGQPVWQA